VTNANGGVIDSVSITGDGVVGSGPVDINITLTGVGGATSASVNWSASLIDFEGNIIDSDNGNILVDEGVLVYVESMLGPAPLGFSNISVTLTGEVGSPGEGQSTTYSKTIQRLRPLDISLGSATISGVDSTGLATNNLTINDGDYSRIDVPVINDGDVPWNGTLNLTLDSDILPSQIVDIDPDSTMIYSFYSGQLNEGFRNVSAYLSGPNDSNPSDDNLSTQFEVSPPPLAELILNLYRLNEPQPGSSISWTLVSNNSGDSSYEGGIECLFDGESIFFENASIPISGSTNMSISMISKPGVLVCTSSGARTSSTSNATDTVVMSSAIFLGAGHSSPSLLGGPWHAGDEVTLSMLLRNEGDAVGSANMRVSINGELQNGTSTTLEGGKAGEVNHKFSFASSGDKIVNWSVVSLDGAVDSNLSGSITIPVLPSQVIKMDIESVSLSADGLKIDWAIDLADGRDRVILITFGTIKDGLKDVSLVEERNLLSGKTFGSMVINAEEGQQVYASIAESGWTIGFGSIPEDQMDIPDYSVIPQVTINPNTKPKVPAAGSEVTLSYTVSNVGNGFTPDGQIVITDVDGTVLSTVNVPALETSSKDLNSAITWPDGDNVKITVTWHVAGQSVSDEVMVTSEPMDAEVSEFTIPWGGILGGLVAGMLIIFTIRMRGEKAIPSEKKSKSKKSAVKDEKIEVACPSCDRRLRVPSTYSGGVKCPECDIRFDVEAKEETPEEEPTEEDEKSSSDTLWSSSDNDILGCPKCARKLKVPYEKRPAKARCPACETIFEARAE
tara:strand:- start:1885 stop:4245 length:2361 start_codon:yes stop_codon:yes gene_type:complete